jgi:cell division initiation protein
MHNDEDVNESTSDEARRFSVERSMGVSPIDMRQRKFSTTMRGFDREEVTAFLTEAAVDYESALRDNDRLRQEIVRLKALLAQFRELEGSLKNTLLSAQKVADDMQQNAAEEAKRLVADAEARAELSVQKAKAMVEAAQRDIDNLRLKRRDVENSLESTISTLKTTLEFVREQDRRDRGESAAVQHQLHVVHSA